MTTHMTKTWFEDGKLITVTIPEANIYKREWVGLTDDEMHQCFDVSGRREPVYRALEAALKEKNT